MAIGPIHRIAGAGTLTMALLSAMLVAAQPTHDERVPNVGAAQNIPAIGDKPYSPVSNRQIQEDFCIIDYGPGVAPSFSAGLDRESVKYRQPSRLEAEIIIRAITWIAAKTGWTVETFPSVCLVPNSRLIAEYLGRHDSPGHNDIKIKALYLRESHIIYLPEKWTPDNLGDYVALLHELVHHLQELNDVETDCLPARERQAYNLAIAWLREQGVREPHALLNIDELTIEIFSQCQGAE